MLLLVLTKKEREKEGTEEKTRVRGRLAGYLLLLSLIC